MKGQYDVDRILRKLLSKSIQHAGRTLASFSPLRKTVTAAAKTKMVQAAKNPKANSEAPPGVQVYRSLMGVAIINSIDRVLSDQKVASAFVQKMIRYVAQDLLVPPGDQRIKDRFYAENGDYPPGLLVISPTKTCNLSCTGCYADSGTDKDKLE